MTNHEYIESFVDYLEENLKSNGTIEVYTRDLRQFLSFLNKPIQKLQRSDIQAYKDSLKAKKIKIRTINKKLVSIKQFVDFLNEYFELGIVAKVKQEKVQRQYSLKDEDLMMEEDYQRLIREVEQAKDIRAQAVFETMVHTGMRVSEMLQMKVHHVNLNIIEDIKGKGGKYRDIYMSDKLRKTLIKYLQVRKMPDNPSDREYLFTGTRGPINRQTVHNMMKEYADKTGIEKQKAHAHNLRHLFGLRLAAKGVAIEDIAKFMGHTSTDTTRIYLEKPQSHYSKLINDIL